MAWSIFAWFHVATVLKRQVAFYHSMLSNTNHGQGNAMFPLKINAYCGKFLGMDGKIRIMWSNNR